jgi:hypothetical protein
MSLLILVAVGAHLGIENGLFDRVLFPRVSWHSTIHALVMVLHHLLYSYTVLGVFLVHAYSFAYFGLDTVQLIRRLPLTRVMILHHVLCMLGITVVFVDLFLMGGLTNMPFYSMFWFTEASTPCLNYAKQWNTKMNSWQQVIMFSWYVCTRPVLLGALCIYCLADYGIFLFIIPAIIWILNMVWTGKLVAKIFF